MPELYYLNDGQLIFSDVTRINPWEKKKPPRHVDLTPVLSPVLGLIKVTEITEAKCFPF